MARGVHLTSEDMRIQLASEEKFLLDRVMRVEKHFASLALDMGLLIRKVAKTRNRSDAMAKTLQSHADSEEGSMKQSLCAIAECFAALEDYRQVLVDRLEAKVHRPLLNFDSVCRKAKEEIKDSNSTRDKELSKQRQLDKMRVKDPSNRKKISQLESDVQKAKVDCLRVSNTLEEYMLSFERKKVQDYKTILGEFIHCQMLFHAKALELYTLAYQHTMAIDEQEQTQLFQQGLPQVGVAARGSQTTLQRTSSDPLLTGSPRSQSLPPS